MRQRAGGVVMVDIVVLNLEIRQRVLSRDLWTRKQYSGCKGQFCPFIILEDKNDR